MLKLVESYSKIEIQNLKIEIKLVFSIKLLFVYNLNFIINF